MVLLNAEGLSSETADALASLMGQLSGTALPVAPILAAARHHHLFAALDGEGRAVGIACLVVMHLPQGVRLLVESMVVDEHHRRAGIGRALLAAVIDMAGEYGAGELRLTCRPGHPAALALYAAAGFTLAGTDVYRRPLSSR